MPDSPVPGEKEATELQGLLSVAKLSHGHAVTVH